MAAVNINLFLLHVFCRRPAAAIRRQDWLNAWDAACDIVFKLKILSRFDQI